ncbi:tapasin-related protein isoform X2 [Engystomops pustulosus]|uniref:tapasin-related protein isoform X2 n=1 Tax=Engystomops pustulosus TaxID=76066 RepID=UPI003AFB7D30
MTLGGHRHLGLILTLNRVLLWGAAVPHTRYTADIVLPCDYALLDSRMGGIGFTRQRVTLVLQNVTLMGEEPADAQPDYQPPESPETTIFLATVDLDPLSFAERLLHAECEGEEVECEISPLYSQSFAAHIRLPEISIAIMTTATATITNPEELAEEKTVIPMTVDLLVSSSPPSLKSSLSSAVTLHCDVWGDAEVRVSWHLQRDGSGHRLDQDDSRITIQQETQEKTTASSLTIRQLRVHDEGTYICAVTSGDHQVQQILRLQITEPPRVTISVAKQPKTTVTCRTDRFYPLDVEVTWLLNGSPLTHISPVTSSHRKNHDGTYSVSSFLEIPAPEPGAPSDTYMCNVSHVSLIDPITMEVHVLPEQIDSPCLVNASIMIFAIVILGVSLFLCQRSFGRRETKKTM